MLQQLNRQLFFSINATQDSSAVAVSIAIFVAEWLIYAIPLLLLAVWLWGKPQARTSAVIALVAVGIGLAVNQAVSAVWPLPRPFMLGLGHLFVPHAPESSFPSDHTTVFVAAGIAFIFSGQRAVGAAITIFAFLVGVSRVYLGLHFPLDVAGSFFVALPSAWLATIMIKRNTVSRKALAAMETLYRRIFAGAIVHGWVRR